MKLSINQPKLLLLFFSFLNLSCGNAPEVNKVEKIIWSQKWFPNNSARLKGAVLIDNEGTLLAIGQNFTSTDSIDHPTTLAKISSEGKMLMEKQIGRTGRYKEKYIKHLSKNAYYEDRLVQIFKTNDHRIILFGYKTFENYARKLWMVEIDYNLNILKDTVFMNLGVNDIGKFKPLSTSKGWLLVTDNYWEENGLSRYGVSVYDFNKDFTCSDVHQSITALVGDSLLRLQWLNSVIEFNKDLLICSRGVVTHDKVDEDELKPKGYLLRFNKTTKQSKLILKCDKNMFPYHLYKNGNQICVVYVIIDKNIDDKVQEDHVIVCYDSSFKEIWRDKLRTGQINTPGYLTFMDGQWLSYGTTYSKEKGVVFFKLSYDKNGKLLEQKFSERIYEADVVGEISVSDDTTYRFYTDNGWRIDKTSYSD